MTYLEFYNGCDNKLVYEKLAMQYLVTDLLDSKLKGADKSRELSALDMESQLPTQFVPSMIYTFMYNGDNCDNVPLMLCFAIGPTYIDGLNFNLIPNNARAAILDVISSTYKYNQINNNIGRVFTQPNGIKQFLNVIENQIGLNVTPAFRRYDLKKVINPRLIEYDMWKYIPFLSFKDAVRGSELINKQKEMVLSNRK